MNEPTPNVPRNDPPGLADPFGDVRYTRWDGTQRLDALEAEELLGAMADELLSGGDLEDAMARLSRWGIPGRMEGLKDFLERLRTAKQRRAQLRSQRVRVGLVRRLAEEPEAVRLRPLHEVAEVQRLVRLLQVFVKQV